MNQFSLIGFLILAVVIATFSVQNSGEAVVKFIWWQFQSSLVVVILISTALGAIMAILLSFPGTVRLRMRIREQTQRIADLEQQLHGRDTMRGKDAPGSTRYNRLDPTGR